MGCYRLIKGEIELSLNKEFFNRDTNITAKVVCDSVSEQGVRLTTFEIEYPRFIHCFDKDTEILAKIGDGAPEFMSFEKAFALEALVASYDADTHEVMFVEPSEKVVQKGLHKMVSFDKNKLSMRVTDKHRVLVDKRTTGNTWVKEVWTADSFLDDYSQCRIRQAGKYSPKQQMIKEDIVLSVWFASDGTIIGNKVVFHFKKQRKVDSVTQLLKKLNIDFEIKTYESSTIIKFNKPAWVDDCYDSEGNKKLPNKAMFMAYETYLAVKDALLDSDGCRTNMEFNNTSKVFAEQVQVLAHLNGDVMNLRFYGEESNLMYKSKYQTSDYVSLRKDKDQFDVEVSEETVYCVTVPSSFVMVRRKGVVFISGNCELMTHRVLSKNSSSSRAIPIQKMLDQIENNMAVPIYWGKNKSGMQAVAEVSKQSIRSAIDQWGYAYRDIKHVVGRMIGLGLHKQVPNRLTEPFQMMKVVITGTDWDNFFNLRIHPDAQPEICMLAYKMYKAMEESSPVELKEGEWHLPYVNWCWNGIEEVYYFDEDYNKIDLEQAIKISAASCASVSYRTENMTLEKADKIFDMLIKAEVIHASPFEHLATPIVEKFDYFDKDDLDTGYEVNLPLHPDSWEDGITHVNKQGDLCSGNLRGWIQYRHLLPSNTCWKFDFKERMSLFS